ncbi:unnamed protein product, partial [Discosporangium mesarthrocarpum]
MLANCTQPRAAAADTKVQRPGGSNSSEGVSGSASADKELHNGESHKQLEIPLSWERSEFSACARSEGAGLSDIEVVTGNKGPGLDPAAPVSKDPGRMDVDKEIGCAAPVDEPPIPAPTSTASSPASVATAQAADVSGGDSINRGQRDQDTSSAQGPGQDRQPRKLGVVGGSPPIVQGSTQKVIAGSISTREDPSRMITTPSGGQLSGGGARAGMSRPEASEIVRNVRRPDP